MMGLVGFVLFLMLLIYSLAISHVNPMYLDPVKLMHTLDTLQHTFPTFFRLLCLLVFCNLLSPSSTSSEMWAVLALILSYSEFMSIWLCYMQETVFLSTPHLQVLWFLHISLFGPKFPYISKLG